MRRAICLALFTFTALLFSIPVTAQECTTFVVVAALDHTTGEELDSLKPQDFLVNIGSKPVEVISATRPFRNRLLILVEADGAADNEQISEALESAARFAREAPEGSPVAFGVYADHAVLTKGFITDPPERKKAITGVLESSTSLGKHVALMDSLKAGLTLFGRHQAGDTVLLVGEPFDDMSRTSAGDVEKRFIGTGTRLSVMLRRPLSRVMRDFNWSQHEREKELLEGLSEVTGGAYTIFGEHLFRFPWKGYMLGLKLPDTTDRPEKWKIQLRKSTEIMSMHPRLYYPERLLPCGADDADR